MRRIRKGEHNHDPATCEGCRNLVLAGRDAEAWRTQERRKAQRRVAPFKGRRGNRRKSLYDGRRASDEATK